MASSLPLLLCFSTGSSASDGIPTGYNQYFLCIFPPYAAPSAACFSSCHDPNATQSLPGVRRGGEEEEGGIQPFPSPDRAGAGRKGRLSDRQRKERRDGERQGEEEEEEREGRAALQLPSGRLADGASLSLSL